MKQLLVLAVLLPESVPRISNGGLSDSGMGGVINSEESSEETTHTKQPQFYTPNTNGEDNYNTNNNSDLDQASREDNSQGNNDDSENKRDSAMTLQESNSDSELEKTCCINDGTKDYSGTDNTQA